MRQVLNALNSDRADVQIARGQIRLMVDHLRRLDQELATRGEAGLEVREITSRVARAYRLLRGNGESDVRIAAYFARALDAMSHLAAGYDEPNFDVADVEALRAAVRTHGVASATLAWFATTYPEYARKIDQASMDRLVTAFQVGVQVKAGGGRWPTLVDVWKKRMGVHLAPVSIKNEIAKLPR
jgi:hypothetical protein